MKGLRVVGRVVFEVVVLVLAVLLTPVWAKEFGGYPGEEDEAAAEGATGAGGEGC